jgi:hypothetical protein
MTFILIYYWADPDFILKLNPFLLRVKTIYDWKSSELSTYAPSKTEEPT